MILFTSSYCNPFLYFITLVIVLISYFRRFIYLFHTRRFLIFVVLTANIHWKIHHVRRFIFLNSLTFVALFTYFILGDSSYSSLHIRTLFTYFRWPLCYFPQILFEALSWTIIDSVDQHLAQSNIINRNTSFKEQYVRYYWEPLKT